MQVLRSLGLGKRGQGLKGQAGKKISGTAGTESGIKRTGATKAGEEEEVLADEAASQQELAMLLHSTRPIPAGRKLC